MRIGIGRSMRILPGLALVATLLGCGKDEVLPTWVSGPVSGLILGCTEAGQKAPKPADYLTRADFDGDGQDDFVVDTAKGCRANRDLFCAVEGCSIDILTSSQSSAFGAHEKAVSHEVIDIDGRKALRIRTGGPDCAGEPGGICVRVFAWTGSEMAERKAR